MAESQSQGFPAPPPFYQHFTKENLTRLRQIRKEAGIPPAASDHTDEDAQKKDVDVLSLPTELRYLIPPEPPSDGKLNVFGDTIELHPKDTSLADSGIEQLYPSHPSVRLNPQPHLIALARSMLTTFLALTGILAQNPELYQEKAQDLQTIVFNMHDLINQYRPHQARESLILMMEERVEKMKAENQAVDQAKEKVAKLLQDLQNNGLAQAMQEEKEEKRGNAKEDAETRKRRERQRAAWALLDSEMG